MNWVDVQRAQGVARACERLVCGTDRGIGRGPVGGSRARACLLQNHGVMCAHKTNNKAIKYRPENSVVKLRFGDEIKLIDLFSLYIYKRRANPVDLSHGTFGAQMFLHLLLGKRNLEFDDIHACILNSDEKGILDRLAKPEDSRL